MLLRHSAYYLLARGLPGIVSFAALAVYTRLLMPEEFGRYALVLAGAGFVNVVMFHWLRLVVARYLTAFRDEPQRFLSGILALFLTAVVVVSGVGALLAIVWTDPAWQKLLVLAVLLLITQAWFELNLVIAQAQLKPVWYGKMLGSKAILSLVLGGLLAWLGFGASAPLIGLVFAHIAAFLLFAFSAWRGISPKWPEIGVLRGHLRYGLPLTVTFALAWVVSSSDRLLISWLIDDRAVGIYAAGYDLAFQGLTLFLTIINTAAYPLAVDALEKGCVNDARKQLTQNGEIIIAAALAGAVCFVIFGPHIVTLLIGEAFRAEALQILPLVAVASALAGIKAYHFDMAFHLGGDSRWLLITGVVAAVMNLALNLLLIPVYGVLGAAWATLGAFAIALVSSAVMGKYAFSMPAMLPLILKGVFVALVMAASARLGLGLSNNTWLGFGVGMILGLLMAFLASLVVNLCGLRVTLMRSYRMHFGNFR